MQEKKLFSTSSRKKIWIDLENSPHVPFFNPIISQLEKRGYEILLTARHCFQVCELAHLLNLHYKSIGKHYGKNKIFKVAGLFIRSMQMAPLVLREKPDLALSHGSRSQLLVASILRIPCVIMADYEYTQKLILIRPTWAIVPEIIPDNVFRLPSDRIRRYPGTKEDVYIPGFRPDPEILRKLGLREGDLVITIRPPATEAHYHNPASDGLFQSAVEFLCHNPKARLVVLPRNENQSALIRSRWPKWSSNRKIIIPNQVVDGLNLIWHSDLVISGGGTMNREAAALGVPVYSIFRGKIGAVDEYLASSGRLILIEKVDNIRTKIALKPRHRPSKPSNDNRMALYRIVNDIVSILEGSGIMRKVSKNPAPGMSH